MAGVDVLHLVDEELRLGTVVAGLVQTLDPAACFVQIGSAWRDHQNAVEPLNGHDAQRTKQRVALTQASLCSSGAARTTAGGGGCSTTADGATTAADQAQRGFDFLG